MVQVGLILGGKLWLMVIIVFWLAFATAALQNLHLSKQIPILVRLCDLSTHTCVLFVDI
jgi:hypothetical protein